MPITKVGINAHRVQAIIELAVAREPDLLLFLDSPETDDFIKVVVQGVAKAIEENNKVLVEDLRELIREEIKLIMPEF